MLKWPLLFLVSAVIAGALGFSGIAAAATDIAIILFFVFAVLFLLSLFVAPARRTAGGVFGAAAGVVVLVGAAAVAIWASDHYSLESAGAELDESLAEARADLDEFLDDPELSTRELRENVAGAIDDVGDTIDPNEEIEAER